MFEDPIVEEIRRVRRAHAARFGNDLAAIVADLHRLERESGRTYVSFPSRSAKEPPAEGDPNHPDSTENP
jgi:hypothetical protein